MHHGDTETLRLHGETRGAELAICMATYNPPLELFERQIRSIREQHYRDWICIVSDDCSTPDRFQQIREILGDDPRFLVSRSPQRLGFYHNFERCLSLVPAGVSFVALSDQDDYWHPDKLQRLRAAFDDETMLVYSDVRIVDAQGKVLSPTYWTTRPNNYTNLASLLLANTVTGAASMFRAGLLERALPFPERVGEAYHDHWLACLALALGKIGYIEDPLHDYVQHGANIIGHFAPRQRVTSILLKPRALLDRAAKTWRHARQLRASAGAIYANDVVRIVRLAETIEQRCAGRLTVQKQRVLRKVATIDRSASSMAWLAVRGLPNLWRVTETVRAEILLLAGIAWKLCRPLRPSGAVLERFKKKLVPSVVRRALDTPQGRSLKFLQQKLAPLDLDIRDQEPPRVNVLIPSVNFQNLFGGYIAKFNLARCLAERGLRVRIVTVDQHKFRPAAWREPFAQFDGLATLMDKVEFADASQRRGPLPVSPHDRFIATTWWTGHIAHEAACTLDQARFVYLIQEYEPYTFPMGTRAALAAESYTFPHYAVFSTELLRDHFRQGGLGVFAPGPLEGEQDSVSFQNAITAVQPVSAEEMRRRHPRRLLFYARPQAHNARNLYEIGILALMRACQRGAFQGDWRFIGIGVDKAERIQLSANACLELRTRDTQVRYGDFLRGHDLGLGLMYTPHPSLVPIEMASAGMLTVTNTCGVKDKSRLRAISSNLVAVEPTIESIVAGLEWAARHVGDYDTRVAGSNVDWPTTWDAALPPVLMDRVVSLLDRCQQPEPRFLAA